MLKGVLSTFASRFAPPHFSFHPSTSPSHSVSVTLISRLMLNLHLNSNDSTVIETNPDLIFTTQIDPALTADSEYTTSRQENGIGTRTTTWDIELVDRTRGEG
ncbi:hypothetical protein JAAARDRAFT_604771 [Jaapia argillacea MUCL 33604]|uniref:Uncharacterized protein n=1 Tax=Jaapia argillacea MUCL 33604 TaxID=933084 RepID=A0A067Q085_9AGAM|nr:hypothetical protein JAAARDRAFT_604771 [Jaapia argillacea MUCL 33604]